MLEDLILHVPGAMAFFTACIVVLGACFGSFLNVCIYRIPRELSVVSPGSHCPGCKVPIAWYLNIPVLSFLLLRGKCSKCGIRISARYVIVEVLVAVLFSLIWVKYINGITGAAILGIVPMDSFSLVPIYCLMVFGLVLGTFVDFEHLIIPDRVTLGGIVIGVALSACVPALHEVELIKDSVFRSALGAAAGWGTLWGIALLGSFIFKKEAMGFGDVKLLGAIGAFVGWAGVLFTVFVSSLVGSFVGIAFVLCKQKEMQSKIPYGPYLALGGLIWVLWGDALARMYIDLLTPDISSL